MTYRPGGVVALAIIFIIMTALGIVIAYIIWNSKIPSYYQDFFNLLLNGYMTEIEGATPVNLLGFILSYSFIELMDSIGRWSSFSGIFVIFSLLYLVTGMGLLWMEKWGYELALISGILSIIGSVYGLLNLAILGVFVLIPVPIYLMFGILTMVYLTGDVKYEF